MNPPFLAVFYLLISTVNNAGSNRLRTHHQHHSKNVHHISTRINTLSFDLYKELTQETKNNVLYSPASIFTALAMLGAAANGTTKEQISAALRVRDEASLLKDMRFLTKKLLKEDRHSPYRLMIANRLWITDQTKILETYRRKLVYYFKTTIRQKPFISSPELARQSINHWIEKKTNKSINNFFPPRSFDSQTQLVLANAISFKGKWKHQFEKHKTHKRKFYTSDGGFVTTDFMKTEYDFPAYFDDQAGSQILEIPYSGDAYSMIIVMPTKNNLQQVERSITPVQLHRWIKKLSLKGATWSRKTIFLPKFNIQYSSPILRLLKKLSITDLFDPLKADLSGIDGKRDLFCSTAVHKSHIEVSEEGSSAASVTGFGKTMLSHQLTIHLNRPFMFYIVHRTSSVILFAGKLANPATQSALSFRPTNAPVTLVEQNKNKSLKKRVSYNENTNSSTSNSSSNSSINSSSYISFWLQVAVVSMVLISFCVIGFMLLTRHRHRVCCHCSF